MSEFWLDSNVLIEAKNGHHAFDINPGFWEALERHSKAGKLKSCMTVHAELISGNDELADWAKRQTHLFVTPNEDVQETFREISTYVCANYEKPYADEFLSKADPWVIAHAILASGSVVSQEALLTGPHKKVKIPNVCAYYSVPSLKTWDLLRSLGVSFKLSP